MTAAGRRQAVARLLAHRLRVTTFLFAAAIIATGAWAGYRVVPGSHMQVFIYRAVVTSALASNAAFLAVYTSLARWWRNPVGRTIVAVDLAVFLALLPVALSLYFTFSRLDSRLAAGLDLASITAIPVTMCWRIWTWLHLQRAEDAGREAVGREPPNGVEE